MNPNDVNWAIALMAGTVVFGLCVELHNSWMEHKYPLRWVARARLSIS